MVFSHIKILSCSAQTVDASVSFSPDAAPNPPSKVLMLSSPSEGLTLWKVKRCGQQRRLMQDPVANVAAQGRMARRYQAATWHGAAAVFVLDAQRELFKVGTYLYLISPTLREPKN